MQPFGVFLKNKFDVFLKNKLKSFIKELSNNKMEILILNQIFLNDLQCYVLK